MPWWSLSSWSSLARLPRIITPAPREFRSGETPCTAHICSLACIDRVQRFWRIAARRTLPNWGMCLDEALIGKRRRTALRPTGRLVAREHRLVCHGYRHLRRSVYPEWPRRRRDACQFDFDRLPKLNRDLVHDLATGRYITEHAPVLIVGQVGVGKSHLVQALGHCAIRRGIDVLFTSCSQLTASLNAACAGGGYERRLTTLARIPLLVIVTSDHQ